MVNPLQEILSLSTSVYTDDTTSVTESTVLTLNLLNGSDNYTRLEVALIKQPLHILVLYSLAYGLVFFLGLIGNCFVITVIYKDPTMRNVTNYFILNLAVADLLIVFVHVPMTLLGSIFTGEWFPALTSTINVYYQHVIIPRTCLLISVMI